MASYLFRALPPNSAVSVYTKAAVDTRDSGTASTGYGTAASTGTTDNNGQVTLSLVIGDWVAVANDGRYEHRAAGEAQSATGVTKGDTAESEASQSATYVPILSDPATYTYNADGTLATMTVQGVTTTYGWNSDGTLATETRAGVTRTFTYTSGNLTAVA